MLKFFLKFLFFILLAISCSSNDIDSLTNEPDYKLNLTSDSEFRIGENLALNYFNDITVGVINLSPTNIKLVTAANTQTITLEGQNIENLTSFSTLLNPSIISNNSNINAIDYNYIGLGQVIKAKDNKFYGLYHGEWHDGSILPGNIPGFYASIGLCVSSDSGATFTKSSESVIPNIYDKNFDNGSADGGYGEPSLTFNADSTAVYAYFVDHNRAGRGVNICMAKFNVLNNGQPDFQNCFFLKDDNTFTSNIIRPKQIVSGIQGSSDAIFPHVTYNKKAKKYFMVYTLNAYSDFFTFGNPVKSGTYLRTSDNGINWTSSPIKLMSDYSIPFNTTSSFTWHPTIIYTNNDQSEGYLVYSKSSQGIGSESHKMWGKKFVVN